MDNIDASATTCSLLHHHHNELEKFFTEVHHSYNTFVTTASEKDYRKMKALFQELYLKRAEFKTLYEAEVKKLMNSYIKNEQLQAYLDDFIINENGTVAYGGKESLDITDLSDVPIELPRLITEFKKDSSTLSKVGISFPGLMQAKYLKLRTPEYDLSSLKKCDQMYLIITGKDTDKQVNLDTLEQVGLFEVRWEFQHTEDETGSLSVKAAKLQKTDKACLVGDAKTIFFPELESIGASLEIQKYTGKIRDAFPKLISVGKNVEDIPPWDEKHPEFQPDFIDEYGHTNYDLFITIPNASNAIIRVNNEAQKQELLDLIKQGELHFRGEIIISSASFI